MNLYSTHGSGSALDRPRMRHGLVTLLILAVSACGSSSGGNAQHDAAAHDTGGGGHDGPVVDQTDAQLTRSDGQVDGLLPETTYSLLVQVTGTGAVAGTGITCGTDCTESYYTGTTVTLTATPTGGMTFGGWAGCDTPSGATCSMMMNANKTVTAVFVAAGTFALTVSKTGAGTVTGTGITCGTDCAEVYASGTVVVLTATPDSGSSFGGWSGCDTPSGFSCTLTMNANRAVTASFNAAGSYTLFVSRTGAGTGTVTGPNINCGSDCTEVFTSGLPVSLTATADVGSSFVSWAGCDSVSGATCNVTMNANRTATVTFNAAACTVGQTRCVAGEFAYVETCAAGNTWTKSECPGFSACADNSCHTVCDLTTTPSVPTVCWFPLWDSKNKGVFAVTNDDRLDSTQGGAPNDGPSFIYTPTGEEWPYGWMVSSPNNAVAHVQFLLSGFEAGSEYPTLSYRAKRANKRNNGPNYFNVAVYADMTYLASCTASFQAPQTYFSWSCNANTDQLDYSGNANDMLLSLTDWESGAEIDDFNVNWLMLTVAP
jgi:hypothetical protein